MRELEGCLLRQLLNLFSTLLVINKSVYYKLNEVFIHIQCLLYNHITQAFY